MIITRRKRGPLPEYNQPPARKDRDSDRSWGLPRFDIVCDFSARTAWALGLFRNYGKGNGITDTIWECVLFNVRRDINYGSNLMRTCKRMGDQIVYRTGCARPTLRHYVREAKLIADGQRKRFQLRMSFVLEQINQWKLSDAIDYMSGPMFYNAESTMIAIHYSYYGDDGVYYVPIANTETTTWIYSHKWKCAIAIYKYTNDTPEMLNADWSRLNLYMETLKGFGNINLKYHPWDLDRHVRCGYLN